MLVCCSFIFGVFIPAGKSLKAAACEVKKQQSDLALCAFNIYVQVLWDTQYPALKPIVINDLARNILNVMSWQRKTLNKLGTVQNVQCVFYVNLIGWFHDWDAICVPMILHLQIYI